MILWRRVDELEYFCVHYIGRQNDGWLVVDRWMSDHYRDHAGISYPREYDVELAMGEDRRWRVEDDPF